MLDAKTKGSDNKINYDRINYNNRFDFGSGDYSIKLSV